ncbi:MAG: TetR family transcriptional regulator [Castellaniella sp.]|uniref:TetR/AcrR family transcriptional regulator n=1 Tax=Castellaniella sp. TaxID=1955812 RepID=UPI002A36EF44|nr:TetR family transcriptional regulator [Castellaniella sp.]MDY0309230.1 TetR family transcriptional regulator [Castellaniella sp.]
MKSKIRLTREQSREQTRQRLLDATRALFAAQGFAATSVEQIALDAGYTRGAFYSNFQDKADIFLALLRREHERIMSELQALLEDPPAADQTNLPPRDLLESRLLTYYVRLHQDAQLQALVLEARLHATRDAAFAPHFRRFQEDLLDAVGRYAQVFAQRAELAWTLAPEDLAFGFMALCDGCALHRLAGAQPDDAHVERVLRAFMKRMAFEP